MTKKPIAIIGSIDAKRTDYDPPLKNTPQARAAGCALGKALAEAAHPILVFSSSPDFIEAYIVEGYVQSRKAQAKSIIMLYPRKNTRPSTAISLSMGLMALANRTPIVSLATFGGNAEEIWAMLNAKQWIEAADRQEMGRGSWTDDSAPILIDSLEWQRAKLEAFQKEKEAVLAKQQRDKSRRSLFALVFGVLATILTILGVFGNVTIFGGEKTWRLCTPSASPVFRSLPAWLVPCSILSEEPQRALPRSEKPLRTVSGLGWARQYCSLYHR
jgi:hypothetical protein